MADQIIKTEEDIEKVKGMLDKLPLARKSGKAISWRLTCVQYRERRTADQNSLMWMWWQELEDLNGSVPKEAYHELFKETLCPEKPIKMFGEVTMIKSTALLDTLEFTKYLDTIHQYIFSKYGVALTMPPEKRYDDEIKR